MSDEGGPRARRSAHERGRRHEHPPADRLALEELVDRARAGLREWTDHTDSDPGVALLDLFAYLGEVLSSYADRFADEAHLGTRTPSLRLCGVHAGVVLDNTDPLAQRRLLVRVPDVSGAESVWALACLPVPAPPGVPATGDTVWVAFESGDASRPVWLGRRLPS
jgi:hypothetical protein